MWSKAGKYALYAVAWSLIAGYVIYSATLARRHKEEVKVERIEVIISDSARHGNLITTPMVRGWIEQSKVEIIGRQVKSLELSPLKEHIMRNGFVKRVDVYPTYSGTLRVELSQHRPSLRLLVDGYNGYVTQEGYVFESPRRASLYVPVVTGSYSPPFPASYRGLMGEFLAEERAEIRRKIEEIEREKYPLFEREKKNLEDMRELRRMFIKKGWMESEEMFEVRVNELRQKKVELRKLYKYRSEVITKEIAKITKRQQREEEQEKKLIKRCEDFANLITFADIVERDKFWRDEVVQIIAREGDNGKLRVSFMVRSSDAHIIFGECDNQDEVEAKFDKLMEFYQDALRRVGWDSYKSINVEYKNQVVCK